MWCRIPPLFDFCCLCVHFIFRCALFYSFTHLVFMRFHYLQLQNNSIHCDREHAVKGRASNWRTVTNNLRYNFAFLQFLPFVISNGDDCVDTAYCFVHSFYHAFVCAVCSSLSHTNIHLTTEIMSVVLFSIHFLCCSIFVLSNFLSLQFFIHFVRLAKNMSYTSIEAKRVFSFSLFMFCIWYFYNAPMNNGTKHFEIVEWRMVANGENEWNNIKKRKKWRKYELNRFIQCAYNV